MKTIVSDTDIDMTDHQIVLKATKPLDCNDYRFGLGLGLSSTRHKCPNIRSSALKFDDVDVVVDAQDFLRSRVYDSMSTGDQ